jgi:formylglycine-generating enzyme required for sulfatase activity
MPDPALENDPYLKNVPSYGVGYKELDPCLIYLKIGEGGMGAVYRAYHLNLDVDVAVKCLNAATSEAVKRFRHEAQLAAKIAHHNLIRVHDVRERHGVHYLVMELIRGENARKRVQRKGPLSVPEALSIIKGAASGIAAAHRRGIVHRDIKPENIMISAEGEVKVADLGIAKNVEVDHQLTGTGRIIGTPQYMPPEQWDTKRQVNPATDVWALGATLYFLLAGKDAITGSSVLEILHFVGTEAFPDIRAARPDVPDGVAALIERCTRREPSERFEDASDLLHSLEPLLASGTVFMDVPAADGSEVDGVPLVSPPPGETITQVRLALQREATEESPTAGASSPETTAAPAPPAPRRAWLAPVLAASLIAAVAAAFWAATNGRSGGGPAAPNAAPASGAGGEPAAKSPVSPSDSGGEVAAGAANEAASKPAPAREDRPPEAVAPELAKVKVPSLDEIRARFEAADPDLQVIRLELEEFIRRLPAGEPQREAGERLLEDVALVEQAKNGLPIIPSDDLIRRSLENGGAAIKEHWHEVQRVLDPPARAGATARAHLERLAKARASGLVQGIQSALPAVVEALRAENARIAGGDAAAVETFRARVAKVRTSRGVLESLFPEKPWAASVGLDAHEMLLAQLDDLAKLIGSFEADASQLDAEVRAIAGVAAWTAEARSAALERLETLKQKRLPEILSHPRALLLPTAGLAPRVDRIEAEVKKRDEHAHLVESALGAFSSRELARVDALRASIASSGLPGDPALQPLFTALERMRAGFARLDSLELTAAAGAFEEAERALSAAGPLLAGALSYPAACRKRLEALEASAAGMTPVKGGTVRVLAPADGLDRSAAVEGFFLDNLEVSVERFRAFLAVLDGLDFEAVEKRWPGMWPNPDAFDRFRRSAPADIADPSRQRLPMEKASYHDALACLRWLGKDLPTLEEWWLAARGPQVRGEASYRSVSVSEPKSFLMRIDEGGQSMVSREVRHLAGNVAEWCKAPAGAEESFLAGGSYDHREPRVFRGEDLVKARLFENRKGFGFRGVLRPRDVFKELLPGP